MSSGGFLELHPLSGSFHLRQDMPAWWAFSRRKSTACTTALRFLLLTLCQQQLSIRAASGLTRAACIRVVGSRRSLAWPGCGRLQAAVRLRWPRMVFNPRSRPVPVFSPAQPDFVPCVAGLDKLLVSYWLDGEGFDEFRQTLREFKEEFNDGKLCGPDVSERAFDLGWEGVSFIFRRKVQLEDPCREEARLPQALRLRQPGDRRRSAQRPTSPPRPANAPATPRTKTARTLSLRGAGPMSTCPVFRPAIPSSPARFAEERCARYVPPEKDFRAVFDQAESDQDSLMLLCFLHLAARKQEIFRLRHEDIDLSRNQVRLRTKKKDGFEHFDWLPGPWVSPDPSTGEPYTSPASVAVPALPQSQGQALRPARHPPSVRQHSRQRESLAARRAGHAPPY